MPSCSVNDISTAIRSSFTKKHETALIKGGDLEIFDTGAVHCFRPWDSLLLYFFISDPSIFGSFE